MNSLLDVLLWVHMAPNQEAKYRSYIQKKAEGRTVQAIENNLAKLDLKMTTTVGQAMNIYQ